MEVTVVEGCISCGLCTEEHPDLFHMDDAGLAEAVGPVPAGLGDQARTTPKECPVGVIHVKG